MERHQTVHRLQSGEVKTDQSREITGQVTCLVRSHDLTYDL